MENHIKCRLADIPCLQINQTIKSKGTILLYHGWASTVENYMFFASMVSSWGYKVIVPELPYHGERGKIDYFDVLVLQEYFWNVVLKGVREAEEIINELSKTDENIGIIGHSCGGFVAAGAFAKIPQVFNTIVINGSCAWGKFEELYRVKDGRQPMNTIEKQSLSKHDPMHNLKFGDTRSLLLLHGNEDNVIPIESQRYFVKTMSNISLDSLQLIEYSGVNHQITLGMLEKTKEWLDKHLGC